MRAIWGIPALAVPALLMAASTIAQTSPGAAAQPPAWQTAAGGHLEFEAASIKPSPPDAQPRANFGLNIDDEPLPPGGLLSASDMRLSVYIEFAYKVFLTREQEAAMTAHLPKWVAEQRFDIEARADGNPTKDQVRLMMQSLLADRFELAVHFETQEVPAFALVLIKPGKTGPRLRPHAEGLPCDAKWTRPPDRTAPSVAPGGFMPTCGDVALLSAPNHTFILGARDLPLDHLALYLPTLIPFGRPIINRTGLTGTFDLSLQFTPEQGMASTAAPASQTDSQGTTAFEALKEQLGLTLKPTKAPVQTLVIDHVEQPTPN